jgi:ABC-2 type transport system ATP-binding protein
VLLASHDLADVETLCDRIAVMHRGRIRYTGTPAALKALYGAADLEAAYLSCIADEVTC